MKSIRKISDYETYNLYAMDYRSDYKLDKILAAGAGSTAEFSNLAVSTLLPGIPIKFDPVELGCSVCMTHDADGNYMMGATSTLTTRAPL